MPVSVFSINEMLPRLVVRYNPVSILEVGPGFGLHGAILRAALDIQRDGVVPGAKFSRRIDAIEPDSFQSPLFSAVYDEVFRGTGQDILPRLSDKAYDVGLLLFVLEHCKREDGLLILREMKRVCGMLIVAVPEPKQVWAKPVLPTPGGLFSRHFQTHVSEWRREDFTGFSIRLEFKIERDLALFYVLDDGEELPIREGWVDRWPDAPLSGGVQCE